MSWISRARRWALFGATTLALAACGSTGSSPTSAATVSNTPSNQTVVQLTDAQGNRVGTATLTPASAAPSTFTSSPGTSPTPTPLAGSGTPVHFHVVIYGGLSAGSHGFQVHAAGRCDAPAFSTAGADFNPTDAVHGFDRARGPHAGDLPDIPVGTDGQGTMDFTTALVTLDSGQPNSLQTPDGTSLVVERGTDDQRTEPEGGAGPRVACGVIFPPQSATGSPSASATAGGGPAGTPTARPTATAAPGTTSPTPMATPTVSP